MMPLSSAAIRDLWSNLGGDAHDCVIVVGECLFHTVEALVAVEQAEGVDPMAFFVMRAFEFADPVDANHLNEVLHLGRQVTRQLLSGLVANGLVTESMSTYCLTDQGRSTLNTGRVVRRALRRRIFHFLHPGLCYVAIHDPKGNRLSDLSPSRVPGPWEFDPTTLREAIARPAEWKQQHRFPQDVADVITDPVVLDAAEGTALRASDAAGTTQAPAVPQHVIVDKAQVIACALVVRVNGSNATELVGYPVSAHGSMLRGKNQPLFSLHESGQIHQAFAALWSPPTAEEVTESWLALAAQNMLPGAEQAGVRFEEGRLVILLTADLLDRWGAFAALALQNHLRWQIPVGPLHKVCPVDVRGADAPATAQLQALRAVLRLEQDPRRADIVRGVETLRDWLAAQELSSCPSPRALAELAFRFARYRLAYEIAEMEDMSDAAV
jgi:hypothetical protein